MRLESERILIRDAIVEDAAFYFELFNDPDWIKYINDKGLKSVEETEAYLKDIIDKNTKLGGLGFFTVLEKETKTCIGMTSALQRENLDFIDIGYAFLPVGRRKGFAREATKLIIEYVRNQFQQEKVLAFTLPENKSSQKLLESLNFTFVGTKSVFEGEVDNVYEYTFI